MTTLMNTTKTVTFSVQPFAAVPADGDAADVMDAVLTALEQDPRALSPVCAYDYERCRLDAIFQLEVEGASVPIETATSTAIDIFNGALLHATNDEAIHTIAVAIVEGDDADLLP